MRISIPAAPRTAVFMLLSVTVLIAGIVQRGEPVAGAAPSLSGAPSPEWATGGCAVGTDQGSSGQFRGLALGALNTNLYNVAQASGQVAECPSASGVTTSVDLGDAISTRPGPLGYPEMAYGANLIDEAEGASDNSLSFPMPMPSLPAAVLWSSVQYQLDPASPTSLPEDFAYDLWVERQPTPGTGPDAGDLEVMLWLEHSPSMLPASDGTSYGEVMSTALIDGEPTSSIWSVFKGYGGTSAPLVSFVLDDPQPAGSIAVDIGSFVDLAVRRFQPGLSQDGALMGVELGSEFDAPAKSDVSWGWTVSGLDICTNGTTVPVVPLPQTSPSDCAGTAVTSSVLVDIGVGSGQPGATTPEAPQVLLLPVSAVVLELAVLLRRRRRSRPRSAAVRT